MTTAAVGREGAGSGAGRDFSEIALRHRQALDQIRAFFVLLALLAIAALFPRVAYAVTPVANSVGATVPVNSSDIRSS